jgi:hypothetical protein
LGPDDPSSPAEGRESMHISAIQVSSDSGSGRSRESRVRCPGAGESPATWQAARLMIRFSIRESRFQMPPDAIAKIGFRSHDGLPVVRSPRVSSPHAKALSGRSRRSGVATYAPPFPITRTLGDLRYARLGAPCSRAPPLSGRSRTPVPSRPSKSSCTQCPLGMDHSRRSQCHRTHGSAGQWSTVSSISKRVPGARVHN